VDSNERAHLHTRYYERVAALDAPVVGMVMDAYNDEWREYTAAGIWTPIAKELVTARIAAFLVAHADAKAGAEPTTDLNARAKANWATLVAKYSESAARARRR
jgi:hypothetical protein